MSQLNRWIRPDQYKIVSSVSATEEELKGWIKQSESTIKSWNKDILIDNHQKRDKRGILMPVKLATIYYSDGDYIVVPEEKIGEAITHKLQINPRIKVTKVESVI